jgi:peptide/nickel transport system permease protein
MSRYIALRFLQAIISLLVVMTIVFMLSRLSGDPVQLLADISASEEQMEAIREDLGLNRPLAVQWVTYVRDMFVFNLGESVISRQPVRELIMQRLPNTLQLGFAAMAISIVIGLPIGIYAAVNRGTRWDGLARLFAVLGQSMPSFWLGVLLILIFAVVLGVLPPGGKEGPTSIILPAFSMGYLTTAAIMRLTRSSMLDVLNAEYIKLARIKGLSETKVIWKHALKNSLIPVITFSVVLFTLFLGAAVVTETVFAWPGLGSLILDGVRTRDYPLIQGGVVVFSAIYILANLMVDILYGYLDPRIRLT